MTDRGIFINSLSLSLFLFPSLSSIVVFFVRRWICEESSLLEQTHFDQTIPSDRQIQRYRVNDRQDRSSSNRDIRFRTITSLIKTDWDRVRNIEINHSETEEKVDLFSHLLPVPLKNSPHFYESIQWTKKISYENPSITEVNPSPHSSLPGPFGDSYSINLISSSPCRTVFVIVKSP